MPAITPITWNWLIPIGSCGADFVSHDMYIRLLIAGQLGVHRQPFIATCIFHERFWLIYLSQYFTAIVTVGWLRALTLLHMYFSFDFIVISIESAWLTSCCTHFFLTLSLIWVNGFRFISVFNPICMSSDFECDMCGYQCSSRWNENEIRAAALEPLAIDWYFFASISMMFVRVIPLNGTLEAKEEMINNWRTVQIEIDEGIGKYSMHGDRSFQLLLLNRPLAEIQISLHVFTIL